MITNATVATVHAERLSIDADGGSRILESRLTNACSGWAGFGYCVRRAGGIHAALRQNARGSLRR
jgi:hypothetical protein